MFIDTRSKNSMTQSICNLFNISEEDLMNKLDRIGDVTAIDDNYIERLDDFIGQNVKNYPNEILLFHFSRRLHGTEDETEGRNLLNLLTTENPFSNFMKRANIEFSQGKEHIETFYKGKEVDWDRCWHGNSSYMKVRLGYIKGREDFCFNGFAFKDLLYKNEYARILYSMPEFLNQLIQCIECNSLGKDYTEHSDYYCYEYRLPMEIVVFDTNDKYSLHQKQKYLIRCILQRLAEYNSLDTKYMFDNDNPIVRLPDNYIIPSKYCIGKEKITYDMIRN